VDIFGVPFSLIPFKGRRRGDPPPDDRPKHSHGCRAQGVRDRFPVVEAMVSLGAIW
jgi:type III restriction enzyme